MSNLHRLTMLLWQASREQIRLLSYIAVSALLFGAVLLFSRARAVSTILVTTASDSISEDGLCSLREAIIVANTDTALSALAGECIAGSGVDTINFDPALSPSTFVLTLVGANEDGGLSGDLDIVGTLTINGVGVISTTIDGNSTDRVFEIHPLAKVTMSGVTVQNGNPGAGADGGGIAVDSTGRLTLSNSRITSNTASNGGGAMVYGLLTLDNSSVENNQGGGVYNDAGLLLFTNTTISNNTNGHGVTNMNGGILSFNGGIVHNNQSGGIQNANSNATLHNLTIDFNTGSGVHNSGASVTAAVLTLRNSVVISNTATSGAGILNEGLGGDATIEDTRISFNIATVGGGGVNNAGVMVIQRTTLDHNQANSGGGIDHAGSNLQLVNVTLSGNSVTDNGGGLHNRSSATLTNVTFSGNQSDTGANIFNDGDTAQLTTLNSIVTNPLGGSNCVNNIGVMTSSGYNLESTDTCEFHTVGDIINTDPLLGLLQDNGGSTFTHALLAGSPAIDAGNNIGCPTTDQRGAPRPVDGDGNGTSTCDIGSFEYQSVVPTPTNTPTATPTNTPIPPSSTPTNTATATDTPLPPSSTPTNTATATPLPPSSTPTNTATATDTSLPPSSTPTNTPTATDISLPPSRTPTPTPTATQPPLNNIFLPIIRK